MTLLAQHADRIFRAAVDAVVPATLVHRRVRLEGGVLHFGAESIPLDLYRRVYVIGAGKASAPMALALEEVLGARISAGLVVTKDGHGKVCRIVEVTEAGHPVVDARAVKATEGMVALARSAGEDDLVVCLLSGGGSVLMELPPESVTVEDLQSVNTLLLRSGATIEETNTVRRHLSLVKGGRLAREIAPATCICLILSDVIGDPLDVIASGPTAPDPSTVEDALRVIRRLGIESALPPAVMRYLGAGADGTARGPVRSGDPVFRRVFNLVLGSNREALRAAEETARALGYSTIVLSSRVRGEAREVAKVVAAIVQEVLASGTPVAKPACLLMGGETTVTVRGNGKGGRNQELALAALLAMNGVTQDYIIAGFGTDGTDGPTDAAGAIVSPAMWERARQAGISPAGFLERNDSYTFWNSIGGLIVTGPTGTNVMDVILALVPK